MAHQFDQYEIINLERVNEENAKELLSKLSQNLCKTPSIGRRDQICDPTSVCIDCTLGEFRWSWVVN